MYSLNQPQKTIPQLSRLYLSQDNKPDLDGVDLANPELAQALWDHCNKHGTGPLVYHNLKIHCQNHHLPETSEKQFQQSYYRTLANNLAHREILNELASTLHDVPVIILKGLVLIYNIYNNPALRPMTDIDLLIHPADLQRTKQKLRDLSFNNAPNYPDVFLRENAQIDLHTHPFNTDRIRARNVATPLAIENIWENAQPFQACPQFSQLSLPHQVLTLSVHALKHGFERNIWLIDILGSINCASSQAQWQSVVDCCRQSNADGILAYALHAITNRLKDPILAPIENLQKSFPIGPIRRKILIIGNPTGDFQLLEPLVLAHTIPGIGQKVRCLAEFVFPRKPVLGQISGLSGKWIFYLSYPLRFAQLVIRGSIQAVRLLKSLLSR